MKALGLCLLFLSFTLSASAQQQNTSPSAADKAVIQEWLAHAQPDFPTIQGDRLIVIQDDRDAYCAYMRTYRMKREARDSDVTRPAGYTTCVPVTRFAVKRAAPPREKTSPAQ